MFFAFLVSEGGIAPGVNGVRAANCLLGRHRRSRRARGRAVTFSLLIGSLLLLCRYAAAARVFGASLRTVIVTNALHYKFWERWSAGQSPPAALIVNSGVTSGPSAAYVRLGDDAV